MNTEETAVLVTNNSLGSFLLTFLSLKIPETHI